MRLENLFESNYEYLLEYKDSVQTRTDLDNLFAKYGMTYDKSKSIADQDYPTPSAKSQIKKAVINHLASLCNDIIAYLQKESEISRPSIKRTASKFVYQTNDTNEKSLTNHISFKLAEYPEYNLQIRISDHYAKLKPEKVGNAYIYYMGLLTSFNYGIKQKIDEFIYTIKAILYRKSNTAIDPEIVKQSIKTRLQPTLYKKPEEPKPEKVRNSIRIEPNYNLYTSKESYRELVSPTREGKRYGFYYDDSKNFREQKFPNEEVEDSYLEKLEYHEKCLINDIVSMLYTLEDVDKDTIGFNESVSKNPDGSNSNSKYVKFRLKGKGTYGVIRISDHMDVRKTTKALIFNIRRTTYTSDAFKENFFKYYNHLSKMS